MAEPTPKQAVAALINSWTERSGLQKQQVAARAGFGDYSEFYRAYLDQSRPLATDPAGALGVMSAFSERLTEAERCRADEAVRFLVLTRLPLDGFERLAGMGLFPPDELRTAIAAYLSLLPATPAGQPAADLAAALERIERRLEGAELIARSQPGAGASLEDLPLDPARPLPEPTPIAAPHRLPLARTPLFQGRAETLRALAAMLKGRPAASGQAVAITGLGGVGKTSLAAELAHRFGQFFAGGVFWISCADPRLVPVELVDCGPALVGGDDWPELAFDEQLRRVRAALAAPPPRLLIFDNCEDEATFTAWRPNTGGSRLLLTSRRATWPAALGVASLALTGLDRPAAVELLRAYRPDLAADDSALAELCALLGDLPLALHLAGSYLESFRADPPLGEPAHLLAELQATGLLDHDALRGVDVAPSATNHELHVGRTFAVSLEGLDQADPVDAHARALLARAGWLAPNTAFGSAMLDPAEPAAPEGRRTARALRRLRDLGLLSEQEGAPRLHPLVAAFARRTADTGVRNFVEGRLIELGVAAYHADDGPAMRQLLPHLRLRADEAAGRDDDLAVGLLNLVPLLLEPVLGDVAGGLPYLEQALAALEGRQAVAGRLGGEVLNNLGEWRRALGDGEGARDAHEAALAIRAAALPPDDPDLGETHNNLAELLRESHDFAAAAHHYELALAIWAPVFGPQHFRTLTARNNLALLLLTQGDAAGAALQFAELLPAVEAALGPADTRTARTRINFGEARRRLGELGEARRLLVAGVATLRERFGDEHGETLLALRLLALLRADEGEPAAARAELQALLDRARALYGDEHTATSRLEATLRELDGKQNNAQTDD